MALVFDPEKSARNAAQRGLPFGLVEAFDMATAVVIPDLRRDYGEPRFWLVAMLFERVHIAVVTPRGSDTRVISLRRANRREVMLYHGQVR